MNEQKKYPPKRLKCELYNDSFQGWKCYPIQKAQLIIADVPYNVGTNFYGSNPMWYNGAKVDENGQTIRGTGHMVFNWFEWGQDGKDIPKIHPAQKPVCLLKRLIETFTDPGDVVIDPCFGSGSTARACLETGRNFYGFEINKEFYRRAKEEMIVLPKDNQINMFDILDEPREQITMFVEGMA